MAGIAFANCSTMIKTTLSASPALALLTLGAFTLHLFHAAWSRLVRHHVPELGADKL